MRHPLPLVLPESKYLHCKKNPLVFGTFFADLPKQPTNLVGVRHTFFRIWPPRSANPFIMSFKKLMGGVWPIPSWYCMRAFATICADCDDYYGDCTCTVFTVNFLHGGKKQLAVETWNVLIIWHQYHQY